MAITLDGTNGITSSGVITGPDGSASSPAITNDGDTNTGIFFPAADTIAFGEGGAEVMRLDSSANLQFNSGYGSVAVAYGCRAWVNFNGTGTPAIRASGNVTSITDNNTGDYTVNFTTAMPDANYSVTTSGFESQGSYVTSGFGIRSGTAPTTSSVRGSCISYAGSYVDPTYVLVVIFR